MDRVNDSCQRQPRKRQHADRERESHKDELTEADFSETVLSHKTGKKGVRRCSHQCGHTADGGAVGDPQQER